MGPVEITAYGYKDNDDLLTENGPDGLISYTYTPSGEAATKSASGSGPLIYTWDFDGPMMGFQATGQIVAFAYDVDGMSTPVSRPVETWTELGFSSC